MAEDEQLNDRYFSCVSLSDWELNAASMGAARQVVAVETCLISYPQGTWRAFVRHKVTLEAAYRLGCPCCALTQDVFALIFLISKTLKVSFLRNVWQICDTVPE